MRAASCFASQILNLAAAGTLPPLTMSLGRGQGQAWISAEEGFMTGKTRCFYRKCPRSLACTANHFRSPPVSLPLHFWLHLSLASAQATAWLCPLWLVTAPQQSTQARYEDWPRCAIPCTPLTALRLSQLYMSRKAKEHSPSTDPNDFSRPAARSASTPPRTSNHPMACLVPLVQAPQQPLAK